LDEKVPQTRRVATNCLSPQKTEEHKKQQRPLPKKEGEPKFKKNAAQVLGAVLLCGGARVVSFAAGARCSG